MKSGTRKHLSHIYKAAIDAVMPQNTVNLHTGFLSEIYKINNFKKLYVVGFGKASCQMAKALENALMIPIDWGILITKYGHCQNLGLENKNIYVYEAGHPVPDEQGVHASRQVIELLKKADKNTLVICLISGGGSALLTSPFEGVALEEKQAITEMLLNAGADINELNTVRKHISAVKGGRLAGIAYPARIISLIISDVVGDMVDVIASGPTAPDTSTFVDALSVISRSDIIEKVPANIIETLIKGERGLIPETLKKDNQVFENVKNIIIGNNTIAINAAREKAESLGYATYIIPSPVVGEAKKAGLQLSKKAIDIQNTATNKDENKICVISGGETTVIVKGSGKGGRNTEMALAFSQSIKGIKGISLLSVGTDGMDGNTDAAGAFTDGITIVRAGKKGMDPELFLENNDSYTFFQELNDLFIIGPTGTNVMDLQIMIIDAKK
jgi:glycerate 2-kinase